MACSLSCGICLESLFTPLSKSIHVYIFFSSKLFFCFTVGIWDLTVNLEVEVFVKGTLAELLMDNLAVYMWIRRLVPWPDVEMSLFTRLRNKNAGKRRPDRYMSFFSFLHGQVCSSQSLLASRDKQISVWSGVKSSVSSHLIKCHPPQSAAPESEIYVLSTCQ